MTIDSTPIRDQVAARRAAATPSPVMGILISENARKIALGGGGSGATAGDVFPDAPLLTAHGTPTTLAGTVGGRPAVIIFYRGAWCPYCNIALRTYNEMLTGPLRELGVAMIAISPQTSDGSLSMEEKNGLEFAVLSDSGNKLASALGILNPLTEAETSAQGEFGLDVASSNADGLAILPMPTTCVIDADGVIRWIDVHADYTTRSEPAEILAAVHVMLND